ncbi:hypothetical protein ABT404_46125, partial [Streptomyces hyaluromycini]
QAHQNAQALLPRRRGKSGLQTVEQEGLGPPNVALIYRLASLWSGQDALWGQLGAKGGTRGESDSQG